MNIHDSIDEFAKVVDPSARIFRRNDSAPWIELLENRLPKRFPVSYDSLITQYAFPAFDELFVWIPAILIPTPTLTFLIKPL